MPKKQRTEHSDFSRFHPCPAFTPPAAAPANVPWRPVLWGAVFTVGAMALPVVGTVWLCRR